MNAVEMIDIVKEYPGVLANDHVSLTVREERSTASWGKTAPASPPS